MAFIPAGWFWMGSEGHYSWESPRRRLYIDAFEVARTSVSRREYQRFLESAGHEEPRGWNDPAFSNPEQPVVGVSWRDAVAYCDWLSAGAGDRYRLPTEAEWEKACRGGIDDADYAWGNDPPDTVTYFQGAWPAPRPVGEGPRNGFGLYHMGDNVHEWCADWFGADYYAASPERNPAGPETGARRVSRGGSWRHHVKASRCAHRSSLCPDFRYTDYGFRLARTVAAGA